MSIQLNTSNKPALNALSSRLERGPVWNLENRAHTLFDTVINLMNETRRLSIRGNKKEFLAKCSYKDAKKALERGDINEAFKFAKQSKNLVQESLSTLKKADETLKLTFKNRKDAIKAFEAVINRTASDTLQTRLSALCNLPPKLEVIKEILLERTEKAAKSHEKIQAIFQSIQRLVPLEQEEVEELQEAAIEEPVIASKEHEDTRNTSLRIIETKELEEKVIVEEVSETMSPSRRSVESILRIVPLCEDITRLYKEVKSAGKEKIETLLPSFYEISSKMSSIAKIIEPIIEREKNSCRTTGSMFTTILPALKAVLEDSWNKSACITLQLRDLCNQKFGEHFNEIQKSVSRNKEKLETLRLLIGHKNQSGSAKDPAERLSPRRQLLPGDLMQPINKDVCGQILDMAADKEKTEKTLRSFLQYSLVSLQVGNTRAEKVLKLYEIFMKCEETREELISLKKSLKRVHDFDGINIDSNICKKEAAYHYDLLFWNILSFSVNATVTMVEIEKFVSWLAQQGVKLFEDKHVDLIEKYLQPILQESQKTVRLVHRLRDLIGRDTSKNSISFAKAQKIYEATLAAMQVLALSITPSNPTTSPD